MRKGALYIRREPRMTVASVSKRCDRCCRHFVHLEVHQEKCPAPVRIPLRPMTEINAALERIAERHGYTVKHLVSDIRTEEAIEGRRECYRYLRKERWSHVAIAAHFHRHERTVLHALAADPDRRRGYMQHYMRAWREKQKGQAA